MKKDTRLSFRVRSDLKNNLESIAAREGRSVAQICEAFLKAGSETYKKSGPKYLQRFLSRQKKEALSQSWQIRAASKADRMTGNRTKREPSRELAIEPQALDSGRK